MRNYKNKLLRGFTSALFFLMLIFTAGCGGLSSSSGVKVPPYRDVTLKNGLKILIVEDHVLPYVSVGLLIRAGSKHDPVGKSGLAEMQPCFLIAAQKIIQRQSLLISLVNSEHLLVPMRLTIIRIYQRLVCHLVRMSCLIYFLASCFATHVFV